MANRPDSFSLRILSISFLTAFSLHAGIYAYLVYKAERAQPLALEAAVMLAFAPDVESVMTLHDLSIAPPQIIQHDSQKAEPEPVEDDFDEPLQDLPAVKDVPIPIEAKKKLKKK
ncbi:hypothetical protein AAEX37_00538 [Oligella sp. MSHR50489EDL]|uniref:hypothetical protein n=1 Tax=Oligella sp. MSHR50489EDL TaxID=3139409 RepID=UPI003D816FBA